MSVLDDDVDLSDTVYTHADKQFARDLLMETFGSAGSPNEKAPIPWLDDPTGDYGPDSYAFASNKPLTLLNGAHLLHLLEKHGHKARINLREARSQATSQTRG